MSTDRRQRWVRGLSIGIIVVCVIEFLVATIGVQIRTLPRSTDFATYYLAAVLAEQNVSPYDDAALQAAGNQRGIGFEPYPFLYPPAFALLVRPLAGLEYETARQAWMLLSTLALLAALALTVALARELARHLELQQSTSLWVLLAAFTAAALNSTGVHNDIRAGSVGILLWLCWSLVAFALVRRRDVIGGFTLVLATILKLTPMAVFAWMLWLRRWRWLVGVAVLAPLALWAGLPRWGWSIAGEYWNTALWPAVGAEFPRPMNQSLDAFWSRLLMPSALVQSPFDAPVLKKVLSLLSSLMLAGITVWGLLRAPRSRALLPVGLSLLVLAILMLMKITWLHTLASVLFVWPLVMTHVLRRAERQQAGARWLGLVACLGFFLSAAHLPVLWESLRHGMAVLLISSHLYGLLLLWWVCLRLLEPTVQEADNQRAAHAGANPGEAISDRG